MSKTINLTFEGNKYTLEYTRDSVKKMERQGFKLDDLNDKPLTGWTALFEGAFLAHHRKEKSEFITKVFEKLIDREKLMKKLAGMYADTLNYLFDSDVEDGDDEGNATWEEA